MKHLLVRTIFVIGLIILLPVAGWAGGNREAPQAPAGERTNTSSGDLAPSETLVQNLEGYSVATFAGGCFWCMEPPFEKLVGVAEVISGYTGGEMENPSYEDVSYGRTKHREAVQVYYSPDVLSYEDLLQVFWRQIDPTDGGGSFVDRGYQYSTAVYYHTEEERKAAEASRKERQESGRIEGEIVTEIAAARPFYRSEEYHQDFYKKSPTRYYGYRSGSGRDQYIEKTWGKDKDVKGLVTKEERYGDFNKEKRIGQLNELQAQVTQGDGTEPAFDNVYWDNKKEGIYVDIVSGEPLFSSRDKYVSGTGWPSFTRPLEPDNIIYKEDNKFEMTRVEVRSRFADSHVGHVFNDGPEPAGLRYCMNSAAMRFIPVEDLEAEGYTQFKVLFE